MGSRSLTADGLLVRLLGHNAWATRRLLEKCRSLTPDQFTRPFEIGPGSLHDTMLHVIGAMRRWADRIGGRDLRPSIDDGAARRTPHEMIRLLDEATADLDAVVRDVAGQGRLDENMEFYLRGRDEPFVFTRGTAIVHVMTHGVHHRAQALNMLRRLGIADLPDLDAIEWELSSGVPPGDAEGD